MSYYIKSEESIASSVRRIAEEQTDKAIGALRENENSGETIHKVRKHLKKLRALMRLMREELGSDAYKQNNVFYRDLGRQLSDLRDVTSLLETLELLREQFGDYIKPETFDPFETWLREKRAGMREMQLENGSRIEDVLMELEASKDKLAHLPIEPDCWDELISSVVRVYGRGYAAFHENLEEPSTKNMHEWRKRVKYLWYHYRLLRKAWPRIFQSFRREAKQLSDVLGDYHDLSLLKSKMVEIHTELPVHTIQVLDALATKQQEILLERANLLGYRLYAEKPKAFRRRLSNYLDAWRKERNTIPPEKKIEVEAAAIIADQP